MPVVPDAATPAVGSIPGLRALDALAFGRAAGLTRPALEGKVRERPGLAMEPVQ